LFLYLIDLSLYIIMCLVLWWLLWLWFEKIVL
jgi:hypothetical protein